MLIGDQQIAGLAKAGEELRQWRQLNAGERAAEIRHRCATRHECRRITITRYAPTGNCVPPILNNTATSCTFLTRCQVVSWSRSAATRIVSERALPCGTDQPGTCWCQHSAKRSTTSHALQSPIRALCEEACTRSRTRESLCVVDSRRSVRHTSDSSAITARHIAIAQRESGCPTGSTLRDLL